MSDLVKNLRNPDWVKKWFDQAGFQAANRIEELEANLANMAGLWAKSDSEKQLLLGRIDEQKETHVQENRLESSETKNLQSSSGFCPQL